MANGYSAGDLYLNIDSVATDTLKNLDAVIDRLNIINKGLGGISKVTKATEIATKSTKGNKRNKTYDNFLNIGKWTAVIYSARRLGSYMAKVVQYGADYTETLNLWETAMGSNLTVATEFVNKMNEAYGISEKTLMNAQAIFKNMLGSLGQISDTMAYALSEGVTQMALDYASLYNVTFEQAFTKFQAALAGQVRPIRSVAGYDITENTLFQLYQSLGGEKTMRQLSRTEKQLLAIYAVFKQMDASGAVGDLDKTMESFANQSRVMAEGWQRTMTYAGVIATHLIEQSGLMVQLNAFLIFMADTLKAVAENMGAIKSFADPFESTTEGALDAGEAIDEVKGKLLGFDKFRSLSGEGNNMLGLDEKLLEALAGFDSILGNADMEAQKLAEQFKIISGLFDENGVFNPDRWNDITNSIQAVGAALAITFAIKNLDKITAFVTAIFNLENAFKLLNFAILGGIIFSIMQAVDAFKEGDYWAGILYSTIAVSLVGAFVLLNKTAIVSTLKTLGKFISTLLITNTVALGSATGAILALTTSFIGLGSAIAGAFLLITNWSDMSTWQKIIGIIGVATTAILGLALAFGAFHSAWSLGLAVAGIVAGIGAIVASIATIKKDIKVPAYANGGLPDKGTMFVAGEAGAEMVYNMPNGQSGVANVRQIEQAMYNALARHQSQHPDDERPIVVYLDGEKVYENTTARAKSQGFVWAKA